MARPGFVHQVDDRTPPLVIHQGAGFRLEKMPLGTQVIYAPEPLSPLEDLGGSIDAALAHPESSAPLAELLKPGMKLTIAFDDVSQPSPRMHKPDVRGRIIEKVLTIAAGAGVDDVELIVGNGLNRRITEQEMQRLLGERVFRSFYSDGRLTNHDAADSEAQTGVGVGAADGIKINKRAAESDLLIYVHVAVAAQGNGSSALLNGLGSLDTFAARFGLSTLGETAPDTQPEQLSENLQVFQIEAVLDNSAFTTGLEFLAKREWEWNLKERATSSGIRQALAIAPAKATRRALSSADASYGVIGIAAGDPNQVAARSAAKVLKQQVVGVEGQADVVIAGVGQHSPYSADSILNPILAAWMALSHTFGAHTGTPVVRKGGAMILFHPLPSDFSALHHPSYVDFFAEVLTETTDAAEIQKRYQQKFAEDPWYTHLYRTSNAFHGLHSFYLWYQMACAVDHCGDIIWVGADRQSAERMGFRTATTLHDALEIVASTVGRTPKISYLHSPPHLIANVS